MSTISSDSLLKHLQTRYATKKFDTSKKISADDWNALEQSLVLSPSSYGLQPWKFVVVENPEVRKQLREVSWRQSQITDASHLVVCCIIRHVGEEHVERYLNRIMELRGVPADSLNGFRKMLQGVINRPGGELAEWATRQVFLALGMILASAAVMGIDACPIEGFEPEKYDEILGLAQRGLASQVVVALGYRATDDRDAKWAKVRFPTDEVIERV